MKLSKSSWHFKLTNKFVYGQCLDTNIRYGMVSLCPYFWAVVWSIFLVGALIPIVGTGVGVFLLMPFWWMFTDAPLGLVILVGAIDIAVLTAFWITYRRARYGSFFPSRLRTVAKKVCKKKRKSLLYQWLKAKHLEICPIFEIED